MGVDQDQIGAGQRTRRAGESSSAPPAYPESSPHGVIWPSKDEKETASITSSIPPDSPTNLDVDEPIWVEPDSASSEPRVRDTDGPDVDHPFAFPAPADPPSYAAIEKISRPVAIPQLLPYPDVGILAAYPPSLLTFGIPESTWLSFLATLSGFLDATVSQQAVAYATKIARSTANIPKQLGKDIYLDTKSGLKHMGNMAKKGSLFGIVGPLIGVPVKTVGRTIGSIFSLHTAAIQKPETPRQRADVYVETANKRWFHQRGLHARIMSTLELAGIANSSVRDLSNQDRQSDSAQQQMDALTQWIAPVTIVGADAVASSGEALTPQQSSSSKGKRKITANSLLLGTGTLWLVLLRDDIVKEAVSSHDRYLK